MGTEVNRVKGNRVEGSSSRELRVAHTMLRSVLKSLSTVLFMKEEATF